MTELERTLLLQTLQQQRSEIEELRAVVTWQAEMLFAIGICLSAAGIPDGKTLLDRVEKMRTRYEHMLTLCRKARDLVEIYEDNDG